MSNKARARWFAGLSLCAGLGVAAIASAPILWGLITALKPPQQILTYPPQWLPHPVTVQSFTQVWRQSNLPLYFRNSTVVTFCALCLSLFVSIHAGYAAARFTFRGKAALLIGLLATSMIPGIAILVPLYDLSVHTHLYNTFAGLILVYAAWNVPILIWLLQGFFESVPVELEEAALIDGCSRARAFYQIVLPISQPGLLAAALLVLMFVWNDFLIAFTLTISDQRRLIAVGLYEYISNYGIEWGQLMAAVISALAPVVIAFFVFQRRLVQGLAAGAVKG